MSDAFYLIGRIIKPHGIRGDLRVEIITDFPERFLHMKEVHAAPPGGGAVRLFRVIKARFHKTWILLTLEGVATRDEAEALRGWELKVPEADRWVKQRHLRPIQAQPP